ncbi:MAG: hypothetical protein KDB53_09965, partial [Planctomycetes bacterium]|nr:hypothetical protein [Planctomycetota bacterium]
MRIRTIVIALAAVVLLGPQSSLRAQEAPEPGAQRPDRAARMIERLDQNGDGMLDKAELQSGFAKRQARRAERQERRGPRGERGARGQLRGERGQMRGERGDRARPGMGRGHLRIQALRRRLGRL